MLFLARRIKHPLDVAVQCSHDADPREHHRAAVRRDQDQRLHRVLPLGGLMLGLGERGDELASILQRDELATTGQPGLDHRMAVSSPWVRYAKRSAPSCLIDT